ncbi:MAG TPA: N-formylglutamate amidohydrolase [Luteolibacter sp.]|nr:N-formylglutamate amidohydrolase [Luteolibacter sp.]
MIACLFSCEHATCAVPEAFRDLFSGSEETVMSPKGWDPGALNLAQGFSMKFRTPLIHGDVTRLLIDLNEGGETRWSSFSKTLPEATRGKLVDRHERPYRQAIQTRITEDLLRNDAVLHVMVHTEEGGSGMVLETPESGIGGDFASKWRNRLDADGVDVRVAQGAMDGDLVRVLTERHPADRYALIRLKVPQSYFLEGKPLRWETVKKFLIGSLAQVVQSQEAPEAG